MSVNCTKGIWQLRPETGEIYTLYKVGEHSRTPIAAVSGLTFPEKDYEECLSNAAVISKAAEMYSLLNFIKSSLQCMYRDFPEHKGGILNYIEFRITNIEADVEKLAAYRPDHVHDKG